jgi:hypothetical protein
VVDKPESEVRGVAWMMMTARENFVKKSSSTRSLRQQELSGLKWKTCIEVSWKINWRIMR